MGEDWGDAASRLAALREVNVWIMLLSVWDLRTEIVIPEPGQSWEPAGAFNTNK